MNRNKFFLRQYSFENFFHGGIGYSDAENIMKRNGYIPVEFPCQHRFSMAAKFRRLIYFFQFLSRVKKGDTIVFVFPVYARLQRLLLRVLWLSKDIKLVCFVADIDGIKDGNKKLLAEEIKQLQHYKYFIAHNERMRSWLKDIVPEGNVSIIEFFDFLALPFDGSRQKTKRVVFAGNLEKSTFLESLNFLNKNAPELNFNLYGPGCTDKMRLQDNVVYNGIVEPYKLPASVEGSFGLVWDGDSVEGAGGSLGEYMRYISHHKLSLYILSGLPLIVPEMAASAALVKKYMIGVTVNSLYEINDVIETIPEEYYQMMRNNLKPLAGKIAAGKCLMNALEELLHHAKN